MSTPEGKVKDMVRRGLDKLSHIYRFMPVQNGMGAPALDFYLCAGGWFIAIETKVKGKKPTPRQDTTIADIEAAHGIVFVVDDQESCDRAMDVIGACCKLAGLIRLPKYGEPPANIDTGTQSSVDPKFRPARVGNPMAHGTTASMKAGKKFNRAEPVRPYLPPPIDQSR